MPPSPTDMVMDIKANVNMNNTLGAAFIGNIVGAMQVSFTPLILLVTDLIMTSLFSLFGITTMQAFLYFKGSSQDRWPFKLLVRKTIKFHLKIFILKISKDCLSVVRHFLMPLLFFSSEKNSRILDATQIAFMSEGVYAYLVLNFMNPYVVLNIPW